jgi:hypothetical protein
MAIDDNGNLHPVCETIYALLNVRTWTLKEMIEEIMCSGWNQEEQMIGINFVMQGLNNGIGGINFLKQTQHGY